VGIKLILIFIGVLSLVVMGVLIGLDLDLDGR
jgi:hypothetical protein